MTGAFRTALVRAAVVGCLIAAASPGAEARPATAGQTVSVEELLSRGESLHEQGEYARAVEAFAEAAARASKPLDLSRAWFGQAVGKFHLQDVTGAREAIRKVLTIDPRRQVSTLFYPAAFVRMFEDVRRDMAGAGAAPADPAGGAAATRGETMPIPGQTGADQVADPRLPIRSPIRESRRAKWEIEVHASSWTVDPIMSLLEGSLTDKFGEEIRDEITKEIGADRGSLVETGHEQTLSLDSSGGNVGFGVRFYPAGRTGSFSFGLSLEKTTIRLRLDGAVRQDYDNGSFADATAAAWLETAPWTTHMSFRWDIRPGGRVCPYFVLGLGLAALDGEVGYTYAGTYDDQGVKESISGAYDRSIKESEEDMEINLPNIMVVLQSTLGLKLEVVRGLALRGEVGLWDGLLLRGGLAYRF